MGQATLTVAAAADLTNLQPELAQGFERGRAGMAIRWVTGASGSLSQQIESGAPYDVFLSANADFVDRLKAQGKVMGDTVVVYTVGRVGVLWKDGKHHPVGELGGDAVPVLALPNPKLAPYGAAVVEALQHAGVWERVRTKAVLGENVRQALEIFDSGNADAVLTSAALLKGRGADLIPAGWHQPIRQKGVVVAGSAQVAAARQFLEFLVSAEGQKIFAQFGFSKAP